MLKVAYSEWLGRKIEETHLREAGTTMKSLLLTVLIVFSFHSTSALATCRVIEYAELKTTSSNDLIKTYCRYKAVSDLEAQHLKRLRNLSSAAPQRVPQECLEGRNGAGVGSIQTGCARGQMCESSRTLVECVD
jgi:hypothetical protein